MRAAALSPSWTSPSSPPQACKKESHCFESFLDLSVPIPSAAAKSGSVSLQECLSAFTTMEKLEGGDSYK